MDDDSTYVEGCKRGDQNAFGVLYDRYVERIYRFIYYKTFSKEFTEDLTSNVFLKALEKIHTYDSAKGTFSAWLYRIARNTVIDHYRTRKTVVPIDDIFDIAENTRTEEESDALMLLEQVSAYLKTLSPKQREIITLRIWEDRSYREIAEIMGGTEDSVKMAFSRAIREVREKFGSTGVHLMIVLLAGSQALPFKELS